MVGDLAQKIPKIAERPRLQPENSGAGRGVGRPSGMGPFGNRQQPALKLKRRPLSRRPSGTVCLACLTKRANHVPLLATPGCAIQNNLASIGEKPRELQATPDTPLASAFFRKDLKFLSPGKVAPAK